MPLKINSKHSSRHNSIEELYTYKLNNCEEYYFKERYIRLIDLTRLINSMFPDTVIWALTSIERLVLMNEDDYRSNWYVIIANGSSTEFYFEYLIPEEKSPWENAYIKGVAKSLDEAKVYLIKSMHGCNGWSESEELKLYYENLC
ncbi:hypothetical protein [Limnovirga soli]|uniref:Uncharacterized protein n=1 Tax=Limnovirga soli TaxID=2656915 RepID=A0A8J8FKH8_9BACT|nr:hypothetical protein [Limnovirga soli]NNV57989.1 hypothetical protein [Limnovirga soli]